MTYFLVANRMTTMHDFGYVALNMKYVNPEDSGTYTCRAVNDLGEAVTSATLAVQCELKFNVCGPPKLWFLIYSESIAAARVPERSSSSKAASARRPHQVPEA